MIDTPKPGEYYRHRKGGIYRVICVARAEASPEEFLAIYTALVDRTIWARPLEQFCDGRFTHLQELPTEEAAIERHNRPE